MFISNQDNALHNKNQQTSAFSGKKPKTPRPQPTLKIGRPNKQNANNLQLTKQKRQFLHCILVISLISHKKQYFPLQFLDISYVSLHAYNLLKWCSFNDIFTGSTNVMAAYALLLKSCFPFFSLVFYTSGSSSRLFSNMMEEAKKQYFRQANHQRHFSVSCTCSYYVYINWSETPIQ